MTRLGLLSALAALCASLLVAAPATASPDNPFSSTANCLGGGYNPDALINVCLGILGNTPDNSGHVVLNPGPCVIGNTCAPIPGYEPGGGVALPPEPITYVTYTDARVHNEFVDAWCEAGGTDIRGGCDVEGVLFVHNYYGLLCYSYLGQPESCP
ncbi:MAG: hypothetical protein QOI63_368 [Thermoplasmata archaeon]|nr:hypothetical protein [Thermoplasmata archaeon]